MITLQKTQRKYCWRCLYEVPETLPETEKSRLRATITQLNAKCSKLHNEKASLEKNNRKLANLAYTNCRLFNVRVQKPPKEGEVDISDQSIQVNESELPDKNPEDNAIVIDWLFPEESKIKL